MLRWLERILILSPWICCRDRSDVAAWACVHAYAGGSRFLSRRSRSHACKARTFRRQESAGRDRLGEKREIRVNVRNSGFTIREFKRVFYNSKLSAYNARSKRALLNDFWNWFKFQTRGIRDFALRYAKLQRKMYKLWEKEKRGRAPLNRELTRSKKRISTFSPFHRVFSL